MPQDKEEPQERRKKKESRDNGKGKEIGSASKNFQNPKCITYIFIDKILQNDWVLPYTVLLPDIRSPTKILLDTCTFSTRYMYSTPILSCNPTNLIRTRDDKISAYGVWSVVLVWVWLVGERVWQWASRLQGEWVLSGTVL